MRWLVILLRLTEMERVATRIVGASPNGKIPHVKLAEKKKKTYFRLEHSQFRVANVVADHDDLLTQ